MNDYLKDRTLLYEITERVRKMAVTAWEAQGFILKPDLWNVSYDSLLRTELPKESMLVGYADDVAALMTARNVELLIAQLKLKGDARRQCLVGGPQSLAGAEQDLSLIHIL